MMEHRNRNFQAMLSVLMATAMIAGMLATANGQYVIKKADEQAGLYNYADAIPLYTRAYKKKATPAAARGIAESYRLTNNYLPAAFWYEKLIAMPEHTAGDELHYAGVLMNNAKYAEAKQVLQNIIGKDAGNAIAGNMLKGCDSAVKWLSAPVKGDLENVQALNSAWSDWSTEFRDGRIIFASDRPYDSVQRQSFFSASNIRKEYYGWTGNSYLHLYESDGTDSATTKLLARNINGDYHSANASYTANGTKFYYAVTELLKKRGSFLGKDQPYTLNVEIMEQQWDTATGDWRQKALFPYNGIFKYSVGDPYISPDGNTLYFVAEYDGNGYGGTDIYYTRIDESGTWQTPVNMGPDINTAGNERTPAFDADGTFYFASDGRPGMGGLDLYKATSAGDSSWKVANMGSPVNSSQDDFAPAFESTAAVYFSSNRLGGKGSDDIYRFKPAPVFSLSGIALDRKTKIPLSNVAITLVNKLTGATLQAITDDKGNYHFMLDNDADYALNIVKADYNPTTDIGITTKGLTVSAGLRHDVLLDKTPEKIAKPQPLPQPEIVLNQPVKLENVYFNLAKWDITPRAATELNKLVKLLSDNPTWKVEIATHTDARSSDSYNMKLSQRRAESVVAYLVKKGIGSRSLVAKGYGETKLVNRCANGVRCTEKQHQENRRTEFTLLDK